VSWKAARSSMERPALAEFTREAVSSSHGDGQACSELGALLSLPLRTHGTEVTPRTQAIDRMRQKSQMFVRLRGGGNPHPPSGLFGSMVPRAVQVQRLKQELALKKQQQLRAPSVQQQQQQQQHQQQNATQQQQQGWPKNAAVAVVGADGSARGNERKTTTRVVHRHVLEHDIPPRPLQERQEDGEASDEPLSTFESAGRAESSGMHHEDVEQSAWMTPPPGDKLSDARVGIDNANPDSRAGQASDARALVHAMKGDVRSEWLQQRGTNSQKYPL
jgi:hypothetical protein